VEKAAGVESMFILPDKDEQWLSSTDAKDPNIISGGRRVPMTEAVRHLTGESGPYDSKRLGIQTVKFNGQSIDLQKMQSSGKHRSVSAARIGTGWRRRQGWNLYMQMKV
jgi:hypothetical protein